MSDNIKGAKELMAALVRMKPKPHEDMKVGTKSKKTKPSSKKRAVSSKSKTA